MINYIEYVENSSLFVNDTNVFLVLLLTQLFIIINHFNQLLNETNSNIMINSNIH